MDRDVFISYKSQHSDFVRQVADQLIASGRNVWFNEYEVLVQNWERFGEAVDSGIARSTWGMAFTDEPYADSPYCRNEMSRLLEHCGPERIMLVGALRESLLADFPALADSPRCVAGDVNQILSFVGKVAGWSVRPQPLSEGDSPPRVFEGTCMGSPYRLNIAGWQLGTSGGQAAGQLLDATQGPALSRSVDGAPIHMNLFAGAELSRNAIRETEDDRRMFDELRSYALRHLGAVGARLRGLHLVRAQGHGQMALTYWMPQGYWTRKHSVVLSHPESGEAAEFVFTFGFPGEFREYCRYAHLMDRLVRSLQWGHADESEGAGSGGRNAAQRTGVSARRGGPSAEASKTEAGGAEGRTLDEMAAKVAQLNNEKRFAEALEQCDEVLQRDNQRDAVWDEKAFALCSLGRPQEALECCRRGIEFRPRSARLWHTKGCLCAELGMNREAIGAFQKHISLETPDHEELIDQARAAIERLRSMGDGG